MVNFKEDERLNTLNHSCAHVMAQAVKHLYPDAKFWVGPVVKEGFYYDIDLGDFLHLFFDSFNSIVIDYIISKVYIIIESLFNYWSNPELSIWI